MRSTVLMLFLPLLLLTGSCSTDGVATDPEDVATGDGVGTQGANDVDADADTDADTDTDTDADTDTDTDADTDTDENGVDGPECEFGVALRASEEAPHTSTSRATGRAKIEIEGSEIEFDVRIDNPAREEFTAGHIHRAPRGSAGGVVRFLFPTVPENEEFEARGFPSGERLRVEGEGSIPAALAADICAQPEQFYVNFHTTAIPAGAIRGQLR
jgi:CHRD domain